MARTYLSATSTRRWLYWGATVWLTLELAIGGVIDLLRGREVVVVGDNVDQVVSSLGYPVYILLFLGVWKILGAAAIIAPGLPRLKEWAYAGSFFQITAAAASRACRPRSHHAHLSDRRHARHPHVVGAAAAGPNVARAYVKLRSAPARLYSHA